MKPRSPIERMVDQACGFDPSKAEAEPKSPTKEQLDDVTAAMLEVCSAACAWAKNKYKGGKRLTTAVRKYRNLGGW